MATAGQFPKSNTDIIYQADYNTIQSTIAGVVSTYYGNTMTSAQLTGTNSITALQLDNLRIDLNKGYRHIVGTNSTVTDVTIGQPPRASDFNAYKTIADYCVTNRDTIAASQRALTAIRSNTLTAAWTGQRNFNTRLTWASAAAATTWWQTQSRIRIDVSGDGSSGSSKDNSWLSLLNTTGTRYYTKTNWDTGGAVTLYIIYGNGASGYAANYCQVYANKVNTTTLDVLVRLYDNVGLYDPPVGTNAYSTLYFDSSFDAITVTNPTSSVITNW